MWFWFTDTSTGKILAFNLNLVTNVEFSADVSKAKVKFVNGNTATFDGDAYRVARKIYELVTAK